MAVYSSLCTLVHGQTCLWLTLDIAAGGLRVPLTDQWEPEQYNPIQPHRPITGLEIGCKHDWVPMKVSEVVVGLLQGGWRWWLGCCRGDQVTYRALGSRRSQKFTIKIIEMHTYYSKCAKLWTNWNNHAKSCLVHIGHNTANKVVIADFTTFTNMVNVVEGLNSKNLHTLMPKKA